MYVAESGGAGQVGSSPQPVFLLTLTEKVILKKCDLFSNCTFTTRLFDGGGRCASYCTHVGAQSSQCCHSEQLLNICRRSCINQKWVECNTPPPPPPSDKTGCWELLVMRSCYTSPVVLQHRNSSVPPAAWIQLHFQSLKEGLIN